MIRVWGLSAGRRSTKEAAPGAFTWREYPNEDFVRTDWLGIIFIEKDGKGVMQND